MTWAVAIVVAFLISGIAGIMILIPSHEVATEATIALAVVPQEGEEKKDQELPQEIVQQAPIVDIESKEDKTLEEEIIISKEPVTLPAKTEEGSETKVINLTEAEMTQPEPPPVTSYYNAAYIEKRDDDLILPVKSAEGSRPFDIYQGDFLPDSTKTYLTLVVSELGVDPALFEQIKSSFSKEVVCAFLADRRLSQNLNNEARELGHETILMLPMEPMDYPKSDPGPETLLTNSEAPENKKRLETLLSQFTGYLAVTPYMGNRFLRVKRDFPPILKEIERRGLGYFEPRSVRTKAFQWKPKEMLYAKGSYDVVRGYSVAQIHEVLERVQKDLSQKQSVILTVQADKVSLQEVQKWLPKVLNETVVLAPLSAVTE